MLRKLTFSATIVATLAVPMGAQAQDFAESDPVLRQMWEEGMQRSQVDRLIQTLTDSIGPRLTGSPEMESSQEWLVNTYESWGIEARNEDYGTWRGWSRGPTHIDLIEPRVRSLNGMMLAWSPGTNGPVEGRVVTLPRQTDAASVERWLQDVRGAFVAISFPQPSCRPDSQWEEFADGDAFERFVEARAAAQEDWAQRVNAVAGERLGSIERSGLPARLEAAGAAGILTSMWTGSYGAHRVFDARTENIPSLALDCEDYGLVARLADRNQGPRVRLDAQSENLGEVPISNTIAVIPGSERPDEYIVLSAHLDTWDGASGANDNATGTITMLEAMRLLRQAYPNPKRTIVVGHWNGEEQGLNGSGAFAADHPEIVQGLHALFNQDNGTGQVVNVSMQGFVDAGARFGEWLTKVPNELSSRIDLQLPGLPGGGGSDYASFVCHGAPAFGLSSAPWDYFGTTWHTNLDTYDKIALDNVRDNAILVAMLTYLASEDPEFMSRDKRDVMPTNPRTGQQMEWPNCRTPMRDWDAYRN